MSLYVGPAIADDMMYRYKDAVELRKERINLRPTPAIQLPNIQAFLFGEISRDFVAVQPLPITIEQDEDESYVVSDDIFLVYSDGNTKTDALNGYVTSLIEFFQIIERSAGSNQFDKMLFDQIQSYIQRRGQNAVQTDRS